MNHISLFSGIGGAEVMKTQPKYFYRIVHDWLNKHYGKASKCENPNCTGRGKRFEYALKKGFQHDRNIGNYIQLCTSCHRLYDQTEEKKVLASKHLAGRYNENLKLGSLSRIGKPVSESTREKIRLSKMGRKFNPITKKFDASY
jgi:hypothetical protein